VTKWLQREAFELLELRPSCEWCDKDLPPSATDAMICTFECAFCRDCVENRLKGVCPNCGGNFVPRPVRPPEKACERPAIDAAHFQSRRLRPLTPIGVCP
jgi:uncharacterized protein